MTTKKMTVSENGLRGLKNAIIEGRPAVPFIGDITDEKVHLAIKFSERYPIGTMLTVEQFEDFLEAEGILSPPFPTNKAYNRMVCTGVRNEIKAQINAGAASEQWPSVDNLFQIEVDKHGERWEVLSMFDSTIREANKFKTDPPRLEETIKKKTIRKSRRVNPEQLEADQKRQLIEAMTRVAQPAQIGPAEANRRLPPCE